MNLENVREVKRQVLEDLSSVGQKNVSAIVENYARKPYGESNARLAILLLQAEGKLEVTSGVVKLLGAPPQATPAVASAVSPQSPPSG
jgi:hypothetical protein